MPVKMKGVKGSYEPYSCPIYSQVRFLEGKWMIPLLLELFSTQVPKRFSELQRALHPAGAKLLTRRLNELEKAGFVKRTEGSSGVRYSQTDKSSELKELVAFFKKQCVKNSKSSREKCASCTHAKDCFLAYGV